MPLKVLWNYKKRKEKSYDDFGVIELIMIASLEAAWILYQDGSESAHAEKWGTDHWILNLAL